MRRYVKTAIGVLVGILLLTIPLDGQNLQTQIAIAINQLTTGVTPFTRVRIGVSDYVNWGSGTDVNGYGFRDNAGNIEVKNSGGSWTPITGGGGNPIGASYWTRVAESSLTNETPMAALATALVINTTTTGVPSAYGGTSCTNQFVQALNVVGVATCASVVFSTDTTGTVPVSRGGTGLTSGTSGGVLGYTAAGTLTSSGVLTNNLIVLGGGAGSVPKPIGAGLGTTTTLLHGNAGGEPTWANVLLTSDVTGILPTGNGGTSNAFFTVSGPTTSAKTFTFPDASATVLTSATPVTTVQGGTGFASYTVGDFLFANTTTTLAKLADASTGNALISGGVGVAPSYGKIGLTTHVTGTLPATNGGTGQASYMAGDLLFASSTTTLAGTTTPAVTRLDVGVAPGTPLAGSIFMTGAALAALATPTNGSMIYCTDCLYNSNPCTGASTGAFAKRIAGAWRCD